MDAAPKYSIVPTRIETNLIDELKKIGAEDDRTVAWLIRRATKEFIERRTQNNAA